MLFIVYGAKVLIFCHYPPKRRTFFRPIGTEGRRSQLQAGCAGYQDFNPITADKMLSGLKILILMTDGWHIRRGGGGYSNG